MTQRLVKLANVFISGLNRMMGLFSHGPVQDISVAELQALRDGSHPIILVDVREPAEFEVSVIPGAITKERFEANMDSHRARRVVAYCTVGGRSLMYARRLKKLGFDVVNFKPSILGWCEAELPLVTLAGETTNRVHTHSSKFSVPASYEQVSHSDEP